jgi:tryptophan 2,3-dioxygenase
MTTDATLTYQSYLQLDRILDAQAPVAPASLGDSITAAEQFFIVVHQAFELWFKQVLTDLHCACEALTLEPRDPERALDRPLGDPLDRAALASGVDALEQDAHPGARGLDPLLHGHQLTLESLHLAFVLFRCHLARGFPLGITGRGLGFAVMLGVLRLAHLTHLPSTGSIK